MVGLLLAGFLRPLLSSDLDGSDRRWWLVELIVSLWEENCCGQGVLPSSCLHARPLNPLNPSKVNDLMFLINKRPNTKKMFSGQSAVYPEDVCRQKAMKVCSEVFQQH